MSNSAAAQEPSMEEILASIRRIITDEEDNAAPVPGFKSSETDGVEAVVSDSTEQEGDTVSGNRSMSTDDLEALFDSDNEADETSVPEPEPRSGPKPAFATDDPSEPVAEATSEDNYDDVVQLTTAEIDDAEPDDEPDEIPIVDGMDVMFDVGGETASPHTALPVDPEPKAGGMFENLVSQQAERSVSEAFSSLSGLVVSGQAKTMEDLVKEMLRPMLQSWLDQNLPPLVEKMVAAEIRRLTGKN
uniref:PopZ family protein n=1 Tax=Pararhizobium sp. IMCC3301 TaxID=3067904 RepID=UPI00274069BE|nr:DUF2497 domain-containing protein [Pararhizobium sp. IMCC3301]